MKIILTLKTPLELLGLYELRFENCCFKDNNRNLWFFLFLSDIKQDFPHFLAGVLEDLNFIYSPRPSLLIHDSCILVLYSTLHEVLLCFIQLTFIYIYPYTHLSIIFPFLPPFPSFLLKGAFQSIFSCGSPEYSSSAWRYTSPRLQTSLFNLYCRRIFLRGGILCGKILVLMLCR